MKLGLAVDGIYRPYLLSCTDLVSRLHRSALKLAIKCKIVPVLHQDALIVPRHDDNLLHYAVEHDIHFRTFRHGYRNTVVKRQLDMGEDRMVMLSEPVDDNA